MKNLYNLIQEEIKDTIEGLEFEDGIYMQDLPYELYNQDYYIYGTYKAREFVKEYIDEVLDALENYQENIGEQYPNITDYEKLASLTVLYIAEDIIFDNLNDYDRIWHDQAEELLTLF